MPWVQKTSRACNHPSMPNARNSFFEDRIELGSIWQCDNCEMYFRLIDDQREGIIFVPETYRNLYEIEDPHGVTD